MARTSRTYSTVFVDERGQLIVNTYANAAALCDALAHCPPDIKPTVFVGDPVDFTVDATPRITLGAPKKERKPRAKKTPVDVKPTNGSSPTVHSAPQPKVTSLT